MKESSNLKEEIEKFKDCVILVEGKKDVAALKGVGFEKVYAIHVPGVGLRERVEQIVSESGVEETFCILTDLDEAGRKFYGMIKPILQELGVKIDTRFRGILIRAGISHIEGFERFMEKMGSRKV